MRLHVQRRLERGVAPGLVARAAALLYAEVVRVERPLVVSVPTLCIGGATLGGSGRTPLAIAATRHLAALGHRVALVGHAYRARPERARVVTESDAVAVVGDEALEAVRELANTHRGDSRGAGHAAVVVVAPERQSAIELAQKLADVIVLDGPLQLSPTRARLSWLAVDPDSPWGSGQCPPVGDLRAPRAALLEAADDVVAIRGESRGVWMGSCLVPWSGLRSLRIGLWTSIARPERIEALLEREGIRLHRICRGPDHGPLPSLETNDPPIDVWLTTGKDWALIPPGSSSFGSVARIDYHLNLPAAQRDALASVFPRF